MKSFFFIRGNELIIWFCIVKWYSVNLKITSTNSQAAHHRSVCKSKLFRCYINACFSRSTDDLYYIRCAVHRWLKVYEIIVADGY